MGEEVNIWFHEEAKRECDLIEASLRGLQPSGLFKELLADRFESGEGLTAKQLIEKRSVDLSPSAIHQNVRQLRRRLREHNKTRQEKSNYYFEITLPCANKKNPYKLQIRQRKKSSPTASHLGSSDHLPRSTSSADGVRTKKSIMDGEQAVMSPAFKVPIKPKIAVSRLFYRRNDAPRNLAGRRKELKNLDSAWNGADKKNIIVIAGWGGSGKTSLVAHWSRKLRDSRIQRNVEDYFDWPFDSDTMSVGNFFKDAFEYFEDSAFLAAHPDDRRIGERLVQLVNRHRTLLILDGLEQIRDPKSGGFYHDGLDALLRGLAQSNKGLCVVTIRPMGSTGGNHASALPELVIWHSSTVEEWSLDRLTRDEGADLLSELGVKGANDEKGDLCDRVKGHPLALTLTGKYLARRHGGDIQEADRIKFDDANDAEMNGLAFSVIAAYRSWLSEGKSDKHLAVLEALGLFDRPATPDCLWALVGAGIGHFSNRLPTREADWNRVTHDLVAMGLLEATKWERLPFGGHPESNTRLGARLRSAKPAPMRHRLDTHLLVREYFAASFKKKAHEQWQKAHACLFGHLQRVVSDRPQKTLDDSSLDLLCHAVVHGCHAGKFDSAWKLFGDRIQRGEALYASRIRGRYDLCRLTLQCFLDEEDAPLTALSRQFRSPLLHQYGECLRAQGRLRAAVDAFDKSFSACVPKKGIDAAMCAMNIGQTYLHMGELTEAGNFSEKSAELAVALPASLKQSIVFSRHAEYLWETGSAEAHKWHKRAEEAYCGLWKGEKKLRGYSGFLFCEYLLENEQFEAVEKRLKTGLPSRFNPKEAGRDVIRGIEHLLRVLMLKARREAGEENVKLNTSDTDEAVRLLASSSEAIQRVRGLIVRAWLRAEVGQRDEAINDLNNAGYLANRGEMKLFQIDIHLQRYKILRKSQELELACALIQRTGSKRRLKQLTILEREAKRR